MRKLFCLPSLVLFAALASGQVTTSGKIALSGGVTLGQTVYPPDIVVYGATPGGISAAIEAAKLGKHVTLLEPTNHVGGITASGLSTTDIYSSGNAALQGFVATFFAKVLSIYGPTYATASANGTVYEPHVAEQAFLQLLGAQRNLIVVYGATLASVSMTGTQINNLTTTGGVAYAAREFIDASYNGDLMAAAGVSHTVGREASAAYHESNGGVQSPAEVDSVAVDPYVTPGNPSSGLLPHVQAASTLPSPNSGESAVQNYNYRVTICTTANPKWVPFPVPGDYNPSEFEALGRYAVALVAAGKSLTTAREWGLGWLPNSGLTGYSDSLKGDLNDAGFMSLGEVGENWAYPNGTPAQRAAWEAEQKRYTVSLLHFLATDSRIPASTRNIVLTWGLCSDEFTDNANWPRTLYVRESRRMVGSYVMTQHDVQSPTVSDSIGLGGYIMDSHWVHRAAVSGAVKMEGYMQTSAPTPYPISYQSLVPQVAEVTNMLVPVCMSASHVAYLSLRVEPSFMIMGQAAGAAASLAIDENVSVQRVHYPALADQLLADGVILTLPN